VVPLKAYIQEVIGSNLSRDTGYPDGVFVVSMAYNFQTGNNKIKLLTEYESVTKKVYSIGIKRF
jgi:hypothetical protein